MKSIILFLLTITLFQISIHTQAAEMVCKTSNQLQVFKIRKNSISFITFDKNSRAVASVQKVSSRTTRTGFTKMLMLEGKKHIFHIADLSNLSATEDYYIIRNQKGHEVIYPLDCKSLWPF